MTRVEGVDVDTELFVEEDVVDGFTLDVFEILLLVDVLFEVLEVFEQEVV